MSKVRKAIEWAVKTANNPAHGYDQSKRWGPDYDCSSFVITAYQNAGIKVKDAGATYTGNIKDAFKKCGFVVVNISLKDLATCSKLLPGDVLLCPGDHVEMYIGNNKIVGASINEKGKATGGTPGDQTGKEIRERMYYNRPWSYVLRFPEKKEKKEKSEKTEPAKSMNKSLSGTWIVTCKELNMRRGASLNHDIITVKHYQDRVTCYGYHTNDWLYVTDGKHTGYMSKRFLFHV